MLKRIDRCITEYFDSLLSNDKIIIKLFKMAFYGFILVFTINLLFNREGFGLWGDFLGGVLNPILTFFTFIGLLITIFLQQKELKDAREEFKRQSNALEKQQYEMSVQTFDNKLKQLNYVKDRCKENINDTIQ